MVVVPSCSHNLSFFFLLREFVVVRVVEMLVAFVSIGNIFELMKVVVCIRLHVNGTSLKVVPHPLPLSSSVLIFNWQELSLNFTTEFPVMGVSSEMRWNLLCVRTDETRILMMGIDIVDIVLCSVIEARAHFLVPSIILLQMLLVRRMVLTNLFLTPDRKQLNLMVGQSDWSCLKKALKARALQILALCCFRRPRPGLPRTNTPTALIASCIWILFVVTCR